MASISVQCVAYAAKSTEDRRGSIPEQLRECRSSIEHELGRSLVAEYTDEAFSAFKGNRGPGLVNAMEHVEELVRDHGSAELSAQHSDRLVRGDGRSARHTVEIALWALKLDVTVRTVQDPDTFSDLLYAVVTGQRNHEDSRRKGLSIASGYTRAADRGEYLGHIVDGYKRAVGLDEDDKVKLSMVFDPKREEVMRKTFRMALAGKGSSAIARALNDSGWQTNPRMRTRQPKDWTAARVENVLRNPRYAGIVVARGKVVGHGTWPAYITERQHARIMAQWGSGKLRKPPQARETYLLGGLARCGRCGSSLYCRSGGHEHTDGTFARRYVCADHELGRRAERCRAPRLEADLIEALFVRSLWSLLDSGERGAEKVAPVEFWTAAPPGSGERTRLIGAVLAGDD